jgi:hypothetical protein
VAAAGPTRRRRKGSDPLQTPLTPPFCHDTSPPRRYAGPLRRSLPRSGQPTRRRPACRPCTAFAAACFPMSSTMLLTSSLGLPAERRSADGASTSSRAAPCQARCDAAARRRNAAPASRLLRVQCGPCLSGAAFVLRVLLPRVLRVLLLPGQARSRAAHQFGRVKLPAARRRASAAASAPPRRRGAHARRAPLVVPSERTVPLARARRLTRPAARRQRWTCARRGWPRCPRWRRWS